MPTPARTLESPLRWAAAAFLAAAAAGIGLQILGGADYPPVPPGLVVLASAAAVVLLVRQRWALVGATAATLFIGVGAVVTPNIRDQLSNTEALLALVGSAVEVVGLVGGLILCAFVLREAFARRPAGR